MFQFHIYFCPTCYIYIYVIDSPSCASYGDQTVQLTSCTPKKLRDWNLNKRIWIYPSVKLTWQWKITELSVKNCHTSWFYGPFPSLPCELVTVEIHFRWGWFAEAVPLRERGALNDGDSVGRGYWFEPSDVIAKRKFTLEFGLMSICLFKVGALQSCFQQSDTCYEVL